MSAQKVANNPLGSYPVDVDRQADGSTRQAVAIDIGAVSGDEYTPSRVSASNPLPTTLSGTIPLPTGAATSANQLSEIAQLADIASKWEVWLDDFSTPRPLMTAGMEAADSLTINPIKSDDWVGGFGNALLTSAMLRDGAGNALTSSTSAPSDSERGLHVRQVGNASVVPGARVSTTGTITTVSAGGVSLALNGANGCTLIISGTYTSFSANLQVSYDNEVTYFAIQGTRLDSNTVESATGTISSTSRGWKIYAPGATHIRINRAALSSGTVNVGIYAANFGAEPAPGVGTHAVTLTSTTLTSVTPGTAATNLGKAIDSVVGATDTGVAALMQRVDAPGTLTPASNDYAVPRLDSLGRQWVQVGAGVINCQDGNGNKLIQQSTAQGITDGGLLVRPIPFQSTTANPTKSSATITNVNSNPIVADSTRTMLWLWNLSSTTDIYIAFGTAAATTTSFTTILRAGTELILMGDAIPTCAINAITSSGSATLLWTEWP